MKKLYLWAAVAVAAACSTGSGGTTGSGSTSSSGGAGDAGVLDPSWSWRPAPDSVLGARWGGITAEGGDGTTFLISGIGGTLGPGLRDIERASTAGNATAFATLGNLPSTRYCGCAMFDPMRRELVVIGGRNGAFLEDYTAVVFSLDSGMATEIPGAGPAQHPVGCMATFDPTRDTGFVFSGLNPSDPRYFSAVTWTYEPATRTFTSLAATGPVPRYDAAFKAPVPGGPIYLIGGLGLVGVRQTLFSDVWRLDPEAQTWTEVVTTSTTIPSGRRYPWVAFAPDQSFFVYGFGSDSGRGEGFLGDLWRFELATGTWTELDDVNPPSARGFAWWLPGGEGTAGLMLAGLDADGAPEDAYELVPPSNLRGAGWR